MDNGQWPKFDKEISITFAEHLSKVFQPSPSEGIQEEDNRIREFIDATGQMDLPIKKFSQTKILDLLVKWLNTKKAPGYDLITSKVLKELPDKAHKFITQLFNAILRLDHFPSQWKVA